MSNMDLQWELAPLCSGASDFLGSLPHFLAMPLMPVNNISTTPSPQHKSNYYNFNIQGGNKRVTL